MRDRRIYLKKQSDARVEFLRWIETHGIRFEQVIKPKLGFVIEIGFLWVRTDFRPLSFARYEADTFFFRGPGIPVSVSRYDNWRFDEYGRHPATIYRCGDYRALVPDFVVANSWKDPREWRWHPPVELNELATLDLLKLQSEIDPWPRNHRGHAMVPRVTGCSGKVLVDGEPAEHEHTWSEKTWRPVEGDEFRWTVTRSKTRSTTGSISESSDSCPTVA